MNWDSVGDEFAGAGPLHQECSPLTFLISSSLMPPRHRYPPLSASSLLCYGFGLCVCFCGGQRCHSCLLQLHHAF